MTLDELAHLGLPEQPLRVPAWTLGCFRRRSITFHTGAMDTRTSVLWLQTNGLTADLRLAPDRPDLCGRASLDQCTDDELMALAEAQGWLADTAWDGAQMSWSNATAFQLHDKWPEPALLSRVGDCLIEFAPSGVYVEDWRLQPSAPGPLIGLRLLEERDLTRQEIRHRGGGLILCGDHAAFIRGRPAPLAYGGRLEALVQENLGNRSMLQAIFAFETSYAVGNMVALSTNPLREGQTLLSHDGFSFDAARGLVLQTVVEDGVSLERRFTVDTLRPDFKTVLETPATQDAKDWLETEHAMLLRHADRES